MLIWNGYFGGQSDSKFSGIAGSFAECVGVDGHSTPGILKVHQKLTENSGALVDELCKVALSASNGYTFWFSATSGKIWARTSGGSWTLAYTTVAAAGTHGCSGAMEKDGYIYWATQSRLHRIAIANADGAWSTDPDLNWATFDVTDADFHPMAIQYSLTGEHLFIGDGNQVAEVNNAGVFNSNVLDLKTPFRIKSMAPYDIDLLVGTYVADTVNRTEIIRWDTISPSWNTSDPIEESGINAFIRDDNYVYVSAGQAGNIYYYDGQYLSPFKKIPGNYSNTQYGSVNPGSSANIKGTPIFGFSNGAGNPAKQGVYSLGSYSRDYRKVLDLSYVVSANVVAAVEIGAIIVSGFDIFVAWQSGASFGVDKIDYNNKYAGAYIETMMLNQEGRDLSKTMANVSAFYNSLPANCGVTFYYKVNEGAYVEMVDADNSDLNEIRAQLSNDSIGSLQIKMEFDVSVNNAPTIEAISADFK